jgi:tetratricopeptide (TPR) repeat protein
MADCYAALGFWGVLPFQEAFRSAKENALKALALDNALSAAHWAFAWSAWFGDWDLAICEAEVRRAIELNPSDELAHVLHSFFLITIRDDRAQALSEMRVAFDLDPLSVRVNFFAQSLYLFLDDYDQAVEQSRRNLEWTRHAAGARDGRLWGALRL